MQDVVQGLLFLLHNPNYEDPYNWVPKDVSMHDANVRASLLGLKFTLSVRWKNRTYQSFIAGELALDEYEFSGGWQLNLWNVDTFERMTDEEVLAYRMQGAMLLQDVAAAEPEVATQSSHTADQSNTTESRVDTAAPAPVPAPLESAAAPDTPSIADTASPNTAAAESEVRAVVRQGSNRAAEEASRKQPRTALRIAQAVAWFLISAVTALA